MNLKEAKAKALNEYKAARAEVIADYNPTTWKKFCDAERNCKLLGVRV